MSKYDGLTDRGFARAVAQEALMVLKEHFGEEISIRLENTRYEPGMFSSKFTFSKTNDEGVAITRERKDFVSRAQWDDEIEAEWLDKTFTNKGEQYTVIGYRSRARKRPILCESSDGKQYVFPVASIRRQFTSPKDQVRKALSLI